MQKVKVHELRKLTDADLVERLTKERVSTRFVSDFLTERARSNPSKQGFIPSPGELV